MSYHRYSSARNRRREFGPSISPATTYAGEQADFFVTPALKAADTITNGWVTQLDGLSSKAVVSGFNLSADPIVAATCDYSSNDNTVVDERVLTLSDLQVNESLCRKTIMPTWVAYKGTRNADWSTPEFRNFALGVVGAKVAEAIETSLWQGSGYMPGFLSDDGTIDSTGLAASPFGSATAATITAKASRSASTILSDLSACHNKAASDKSAILTKQDLAFYLSPVDYAYYQQALAFAGGSISHDGATTVTSEGQGYGAAVSNQNLNNLTFMGIPVYRVPGMPAEYIVLACASNLFLGSNLRTDYTEVQYIPAYQYDGSDNVKVVMRFGAGVQIGIPADCILGKA